MSNELTEFQRRVYDLLAQTPDEDVKLRTIYGHAYELVVMDETPRQIQQKLAPTFTRINERLVGQRIEPGQLKRTYRLNTNYAG